jgi:hypothetical protein
MVLAFIVVLVVKIILAVIMIPAAVLKSVATGNSDAVSVMQ